MSDGAVMEWLAAQQDRLYGDLRDSMRSSEARAEFANDLNDIKAGLHSANKSHDFKQVDAQMQALLQKYGGDPEFADLCDGLNAMADTIRGGIQAQLDNQRAIVQSRQDIKDFVKAGGRMDGEPLQFLDPVGSVKPGSWISKPVEVAPIKAQEYDKDQLDSWDQLIGGKLDVAGKNDQLTMIHIQQLKSTIDQGSQFGSQFIASGDKTSNSIINNIA